MSESERGIRGYDAHIRTATERRAYAAAEGFTKGTIVYRIISKGTPQQSVGRTPYEIVGTTDTPTKFLLRIRVQGDTTAEIIDAIPSLLTKVKPVKARKPGSRH
ncbi:hypothetical protein K2X83_02015 [Patescibacteria group bacterium]|nr:hypothetical protein [Patescibacteria group bacterium]